MKEGSEVDSPTRCWFRVLLQAIKCGIELPEQRGSLEGRRPLEIKQRNHSSYYEFMKTHDEALESMVGECVIEAASTAPEAQCYVRAVAASLTVLKRSDLRKVLIASGLEIINEDDLKEYEHWRVHSRPDHLPDPGKVKVRLAVNLTGNGVNDYSPDVHMISPTIQEAIGLMAKGCHFAVIDLKNAYYHYRISTKARDLLGVIDGKGKIYRYRSLPFGLRIAPAWASVFIGEVMLMLKARGIRGMAYIDDILIVADSQEQLEEQLKEVLELLRELGLEANETKLQIGQRVVYLGVLLNGQDATVTACPTKAAQVEVDLKWAWEHRREVRRSSVVREQWRSLLGRLQWFAGLEQAGRCHLASFWDLFAERRPVALRQLQRDFEWWQGRLKAWISSEAISPSAALMTRGALATNSVILISDAGEHGFGYVLCPINQLHQAVTFSMSWEAYGHKPHSSTGKELCAPLHVIRQHEELVRGRILICVTDSACMAANLLSGVSHGAHRADLVEVMEKADAVQCYLIAHWVRRDLNQYCDYLASLAASLSLPFIHGRLDLSSARSGRSSEEGQGSDGGGRSISDASRDRGVSSTEIYGRTDRRADPVTPRVGSGEVVSGHH